MTPSDLIAVTSQDDDADAVELPGLWRLDAYDEERELVTYELCLASVDGGPAADVSVVLTRRTGGSVDWMRTGPDGRYDLPVPKEGTYVVTAVDRSTSAIITRTVVLGGSAVRTDLQLQAATVTAPAD